MLKSPKKTCTIEHMFARAEVTDNSDVRLDANADVLARWHDLQQAEVAFADAVIAWDRCDGWALDGARSPASWLRQHLKIGFGQAADRLFLARRLRRSSAIRGAVHKGRLSMSQARELLEVFTAKRREFTERDEAMLVAQCESLSHADTRTLAKHWSARVDAELDRAAPETTPKPPTSELYVAETIDGAVILNGSLETGDGEVFRTALDAARRLATKVRTDAGSDGAGEANPNEPPAGPNAHRDQEDDTNDTDTNDTDTDDTDDGPDDHRNAAEQRAAALMLMARYFLDHCDDISQVGGERPHITITIDAATLAGHASGHGRAEFSTTGIDIDQVRQWCCDSRVARVILAGDSQVIDVGRATRTVPAALRTAVTIRDRHCRFAGCELSARYSDVHHILEWVNGGPTSRANCVLLCRYHHRLIHCDRWTITGDPNYEFDLHLAQRPDLPIPTATGLYAYLWADVVHAGSEMLASALRRRRTRIYHDRAPHQSQAD